MKLGQFVWTIANDYGARIPDDDTKQAMSFAFFKVHDGLEWQNYSPEGTNHYFADVYGPQGIGFVPWGVARGWNIDVAREEGRLAGRHAAACQGVYILDLEPYPEDYWQGIPGTPTAFVEGFLEAGGNELWICPDARNTGINLEEWVRHPVVTRWWPQAYYTAFQQPMVRGINAAIAPLLNAGIPRERIWPVLPTYYATEGEPSIDAGELIEAIRYVASEGYPGAALWRRGLISPGQVTAMLETADPFSPGQLPSNAAKDAALMSLDIAAQAIEDARRAVEAIP